MPDPSPIRTICLTSSDPPPPSFLVVVPLAGCDRAAPNMQHLETIHALDDRIIRRQDRDIKELNAGIVRLADIVNRRPLY